MHEPSTRPPSHLASSRTAGLGLLLVAASLVLAYGIAYVTGVIRWMNFWMRGPYFVSYQLWHLSALLLLLIWWMSRHHNGPLPVLSTSIYSLVAGYAAGVIAMVLYPVSEADGFQQALRSMQFTTPEAAIAFFWFPVRLLTWLFGGLTGVVLLTMSRAVERRWFLRA